MLQPSCVVCVSAVVMGRIADDRGPREEVVAMARRREDCIGEDIHLAMAVMCALCCYAAMPVLLWVARCSARWFLDVISGFSM